MELTDGSKVVVFADAGGVGDSLVERLHKRGVDVLELDGSTDSDGIVQSIDAWAGRDSVTGVYWLPALDVEDPIESIDLGAWREALRIRVKLLYSTMRHLYDTVGGAGTFLVSATRLGGQHGYGADAPTAPMGGAVSGFTKTFKREKPEALVKVVDFAPSRKTAALADMLIDETLADPGVVEIGRPDDGSRWTIGLTDVDLPDEANGIELGPESVFVVTGAAGSIVSAITADLAAASGGTFHLLDLVPEPDRDGADVALFRSDLDELRRVIFTRLKDSGERATPAMVEREIAGIERASAALAAIEAIEEAGGTAVYHSVNLLDGDAMAEVTASIADEHERIDVVLHAGGLEISRLLPDKEPSEYDLVFDVKADGWFSLLRGLADREIGAIVGFSSIAGRFGNGGQSDYSAANDLLCKYCMAFARTRPETTAIAIDWTAWGDIGMATRGSIPTVMKAAGIDMLPAAIGTPLVRREITTSAGSREVLVAGRLGMLMDEFADGGGVDADAMSGLSSASVMVGEVTSMGIHTGLVVTTTLDPAEQGFLFDHRIDGTPVLPGVMGVEAFAEVAGLPWDDLFVTAIEDVDFVAPFKFYRDEPREITVTAMFAADGDDVVADCSLIGVRQVATSDEPQVTTHFTGRVRLSSERPRIEAGEIPERADTVGSDDVYSVYFHGPVYQVLDAAWTDGDVVAGALAADLPPNHVPEADPTVIGPRLVELCFQTAGVWEIGTTGEMALPTHIDKVVIASAAPDDRADGLTALVMPRDGSFDAVVMDDDGEPVIGIEGYRTIHLPGALADDDVAPIREAMTLDD